MQFEIPPADPHREILVRLRSAPPSARTPVTEETRLRERIRSIGASCRLAGIRVVDDRVPEVLAGNGPPLPGDPEIRGYAAALDLEFSGPGSLLTTDRLCQVHGVMIGSAEGQPTPLRNGPCHRESFSADGQATGLIFTTLPHHLVPQRLEQLLTWVEMELRSREQPAPYVIAAFLLGFLSVSPFEYGNGRLARLLFRHLAIQVGFEHIAASSLEAEIEKLRDRYQEACSRSETRIWLRRANLRPWIDLVLTVLDNQLRSATESRERPAPGADPDSSYPPLQQAILELAEQHGTVNAGLLLDATQANRNTLKDNLRRLVDRGVLERTGSRRGTRYHLRGPGPEAAPE